MAIKGRQVAEDLEEKTAGQPMSRRTFVTVVGGAAALGIASWFGLNWFAPDVVPGPKQLKYVTAKEAVEDLIYGNDYWPNAMKSYKKGDTLYVKDKIINVAYDAANERWGIIFETAPNSYIGEGKGNWAFMVGKSQQPKAGEVIIFSSPVDRYVVGGNSDTTYYGVVWDIYTVSGKNKITKT